MYLHYRYLQVKCGLSSETNMSRPVIRVGDFHAGHVCKTYHATPFITGSLSVLTNSKPTVRFGDVTFCTFMIWRYT